MTDEDLKKHEQSDANGGRDLLLALLGIALCCLSVVGHLAMHFGHHAVHQGSEYVQQSYKATSHVGHDAVGSPNVGGQPDRTGPGLEEPTSTSDLCGNCARYPDTCDPIDGLKCLGFSIAVTVGAVLKHQLIVGLLNTVIWACFVVPIVLLVLAWLLWELAERLEKSSRNCSGRRKWWQRIWCYVKRVLVWVFRILAILSIIATIISLILCIVAIVGLILI
jgi:hypothetical protein